MPSAFAYSGLNGGTSINNDTLDTERYIYTSENGRYVYLAPAKSDVILGSRTYRTVLDTDGYTRQVTDSTYTASNTYTNAYNYGNPYSAYYAGTNYEDNTNVSYTRYYGAAGKNTIEYSDTLSGSGVDLTFSLPNSDYVVRASNNTVGHGAASVAIGNESIATNGSVSIGDYAYAYAIGGPNNNGDNAGLTTAIGTYSVAKGAAATALGAGSLAQGNGSTAVGRQSAAIGTYAQSFGSMANSIGNSSNAIGQSATALGAQSIAIGSANISAYSTTSSAGLYQPFESAQALGERSIAFGGGATAGTTVQNTTTGKISNKSITYIDSVDIDTGKETTKTGEQGADAISIGHYAKARRDNSIAMGAHATVSGTDGMALGSYSNASGYNTVAIGANADASGHYASALGVASNAKGFESLALGFGAYSGGSNSIAGGNSSAALGKNAIALGSEAKAESLGTMALGTKADAKGDYAMAFGQSANALEKQAVAIGSTSNAAKADTIAIGTSAQATAVNTAAIGSYSASSAANAFAAGVSSQATGAGATAIGYAAKATAKNAIAIGGDDDSTTASATASGEASIAIGDQAIATGTNSISIGTKNKVTANKAVAIGDPTDITGEGSFSLGNDNGTEDAGTAFAATNSGIFGNNNKVTSGDAIRVIGNSNTVTGSNSMVIGNSNTVSTENTFVLGNNVTSTAARSVILGDKSGYTEKGTSTEGLSTDYTSGMVNGYSHNFAGGASNVGVVSVGTAGSSVETRRIQNVAPGLISNTSTDAINGSQLYAVVEEVNKGFNLSVDKTGSGTSSTTVSAKTAGSDGFGVTVIGTPGAADSTGAITTDYSVDLNDKTKQTITNNTTNITNNANNISKLQKGFNVKAGETTTNVALGGETEPTVEFKSGNNNMDVALTDKTVTYTVNTENVINNINNATNTPVTNISAKFGVTAESGDQKDVTLTKDNVPTVKFVGDGNIIKSETNTDGVKYSVDETNLNTFITNNETVKAAKTVVKQGQNVKVEETKGENGESIYTVSTDLSKLGSMSGFNATSNGSEDAAKKANIQDSDTVNFVDGTRTTATTTTKTASDGSTTGIDVSYDLNDETKTKIDNA
ncbi:hemagglutinin [Pasteurella bettyae]|uniref:Hemagglutinin n=1 Tax=Pasteurella bettyae CCUG 2042 TaxID=1095749 RepID=I3DEJ0_9PAST|nr:hemagglutinin [Pasteurella bettyae]EIJ70133.1 hemagglutinin [Pasteurella bettyae CCUG 2042]SUB21915.1 autotransporter adhesin [Pasteurella bettyae]